MTSGKLVNRAVGIFVILCAVGLAYQPVIQGDFLWDDDTLVSANELLRNQQGLRKIWTEPGATAQYYPLTFSVFWLGYQLWGLNTSGYHLLNILLHGLNALWVWKILCRLKCPGAFAAALLFALHPVHVESVAWISELKNVLSAQFYLLALNQYLDYVLPGDRPEHTKTSVISYIFSLVFYLCALLSKTITCTFPIAVLILLWWKTGRVHRRDVVPLIPFLALGAGFALGTAWMEKQFVGASGEGWTFTFIERCLIAGRAFWFYPGKLLWPVNLSFMYPRWNVATFGVIEWLLPITAAGTMLALWLTRRRISKGPLAAALFYGATIFPSLGFVDIETMLYTFVADHYQYLASIGIIVLTMAGVRKGLSNLLRSMGIHTAGLTILAFLFGLLTWRQSALYQNNLVLFDDVLRKNPRCWEGFLVRGTAYAKKGNHPRAIADLSQALALRPDYAKAYNNRGTIYSYEGQYSKALRDFDQAIRLKPDYARAYNNRGFIHYMEKNFTAALKDFDRAIELDPEDNRAYFNRARIRKIMGDPDGAESDFDKAKKASQN
jgi:hypothetical protein